MAEYWQDVLARGQATNAVWEDFFPNLTLGAVDYGNFEGFVAALQPGAQLRDDAVQADDNARQARDNAVGSIRMLSLAVPKLIEGQVDAESGLLDDLDKVYAITPWSPAKASARGQLLAPLWASANAWQLAQTPPRAVITRGTVTQAIFLGKLTALPDLLQAVADTGQKLDEARTELARRAREVESLAVRFLKAAGGLADPGTPAAAALETIPTSTTSSLPETLGIRTFTQGGTGGLQLLIAFEPYALEADETAVVQWQVLDTDPGWDHSVPYDASGLALGPFTVGQTVRVRTRVSNPSGSRDGGPRQLTLLVP